MQSSFLKAVLKKGLAQGGMAFVLALVFQTAAQAQSHTFAKWTSATAFRLGNVSCTAALGAKTNQAATARLLGAVATPNSPNADTTNYPGIWFTPMPPAGTTWSQGELKRINPATDASEEFTVTCSQAIPNPRMHIVNMDASQLAVTSPSSNVSKLSGNLEFGFVGNVLNSDKGAASQGGCEADDGTNGNGACGSVEITGSYSSLSFLNSGDGDGWLWTLSANTWSIGGTVSGLSAGSLVLQNNLGDDVTVSANGSFSFPLGNIDGTTYAVTVKTQPAGHFCSVSSGTGTAGADVTNVAVTCVLAPAAPTVTSVSPSSGPTAGGTSITITGTDLSGATSVTIGGNACTNVVATATSITCTTPPGTAGTASVLVTTPGGTNAANTLFTYIAPAPTAIPTLSEWAMILLASLLAMFAIRRMRGR